MSDNNSSKVSIANIIALIGLAGLGVITFFGLMLSSDDGSLGTPVIGAVAFVAVLFFFLFMSIKAKGAESNTEKWRIVEYVCLACYIIVAVVFAKPFMRFFSVLTQKSELQQQAKAEIMALKSLYDEYNQQKDKFMKEAVEQIKNYQASKQGGKDSIAQYVAGVGNVDTWASKAQKLVKMEDVQLMELNKRVSDWNLLDLPALASDLSKKDSTAVTKLEEKIKINQSKHKLIPVIGGGGSKPYVLTGYAQFNLKKTGGSKFAQMLKEGGTTSPVAWIVYAVLHLLVLLNYLVAPRSLYVGPSAKRVPKNGLEL